MSTLPLVYSFILWWLVITRSFCRLAGVTLPFPSKRNGSAGNFWEPRLIFVLEQILSVRYGHLLRCNQLALLHLVSSVCIRPLSLHAFLFEFFLFQGFCSLRIFVTSLNSVHFFMWMSIHLFLVKMLYFIPFRFILCFLTIVRVDMSGYGSTPSHNSLPGSCGIQFQVFVTTT